MRLPATAPSSAMPAVTKGSVYLMYAFDVAPHIDLELCERSLATAQRLAIRTKRRALQYFAYRPAPLRVQLDAESIALGTYRTEPSIDVVLYDFGAVSVTYTIKLQGSHESLVSLSGDLYDNEALLADSRRQIERVFEVFPAAVPSLGVTVGPEDYVVYHLEAFVEPLTPERFSELHRREMAQLLRAEPLPLSDQEVADAGVARIGFGPDDLAVIDWNAAVLLGGDVEDLRTVLEFANVQLVELRFLDRQLDDALEQSYALVSRRRWTWPALLRSYRSDAQRVARLQVDAAMLFERVTNALKLFGEEYLTRVYRLAAERFRLSEWDANILRKLHTLESVYGKLTDQAAARRLELLEWVIVLLIALSIVLAF